VGRWTRNVLRALATGAPSWDIRVTIVTKDPVETDVATFGPNVSLHVVRFPERWFRRALLLGVAPRIERTVGRADAMLGPGFVTWPGSHAQIPVIHDLAFLNHPGSVQRRNLAFLRLLMPRVVRRAAGIVTVSGAMRDEIVDRFTFDKQKVFVVPNASEAVPALSTSSVKPGYLLFVGTFEPRKNLSGVLDAYRRLRSERKDVPDLVVVGGLGWRGAEELRREADGTPGVLTVGYVDDARLNALYRDARMLVFPSLYEGFGLPVVEAMGAGTPVVTSRRGGLPEVAGDAAVYVDPLDPSDIARGIARLLDDPGEAARLGEAGLRQASQFTWERSGQMLKGAIETITAKS
jgi:glycosyltransferase involved in cell wall biosynthesis